MSAILLCYGCKNLLLFLSLYAISAVTDILDGFIARRFNAQTALGAKLDSAADFLFFAAVLTAACFYINLIDIFFIIGAVIIAVIRSFNLILTKAKFAKFGMLHTIANKITGLLIFISVPIFIWLKQLFYPLLIPVFISAFLSAFEESIILVTSKQYNADRKSLFIYK